MGPVASISKLLSISLVTDRPSLDTHGGALESHGRQIRETSGDEVTTAQAHLIAPGWAGLGCDER
jgi:hypothetical protein